MRAWDGDLELRCEGDLRFACGLPRRDDACGLPRRDDARVCIGVLVPL